MATHISAITTGEANPSRDGGTRPFRDWSALTTAGMRSEFQKGPGEIFLVSHYVYRPFTIYLTMLYARLGAGANAVSVHSCVAALLAAGCCLYPRPLTFLLAAVGLQAYFVLDHVDGELARLRLWTGEMNPNPSGAFLDFWVHFHSINVVVACLGIGLTVQSGQMIWAVAGIAAANVLSNFTKLTLARTMLRDQFRMAARDDVKALIEHATDAEPPVLNATVFRRRQAFQIVREIAAFPGPVIILSVTLAVDAMLFADGRLDAPFTKLYLGAFALAGVASKLLRTRQIVRRLNALEYR